MSPPALRSVKIVSPTSFSRYTPAMRIKSHVTGNTGTLDFECLWMNVDDNTIGAHAFSSMSLARVKGHWLVKAIKVGKVEKL